LDLWTLTNNLALLAVISHFIQVDGKLCYAVLLMKEVEGEHTGANLAKTFISIAKEYNLIEKIGYFVIDNATSNNTLIEYIKSELNELGIEFNPMEKRLWYIENFKYIFNISNIL
jgi:hypothetical protein